MANGLDLRMLHQLMQGMGGPVPGAAPDVGAALGGAPPPVNVGPGGFFPSAGAMPAMNMPGSGMSASEIADVYPGAQKPGAWDFGAALKTMFGDPQNVGVLGAGALHLMGQPDRAKALMGLTQSHGAGKGAKATLGGDEKLTTAEQDGTTSVVRKAAPDGREVEVTTRTLPRKQDTVAGDTLRNF